MRVVGLAVIFVICAAYAAFAEAVPVNCERFNRVFEAGKVAKGFALEDAGEAMMQGKDGKPGQDRQFLMYAGRGCVCEGDALDHNFRLSEATNWRCSIKFSIKPDEAK